jgi:hypothetical protein
MLAFIAFAIADDPIPGWFSTSFFIAVSASSVAFRSGPFPPGLRRTAGEKGRVSPAPFINSRFIASRVASSS